MNSHSLFPEYAVLETGRNEAQAMRLAQQLSEVDLQMLVTDPDRRAVVQRLRREGIDNAMQLILLTQEEVLSWPGVGPVFLSILSQMRQQVVGQPERIVDTWHHQHRLYVVPDDLELDAPDADFFGVPIISAAASTAAPAPAAEASVALLEQSLLAAITMMGHRDAREGTVLRKYYVDGLPTEAIVASCRLASAATLSRIVGIKFREPLLQGYPVRGIQFSDGLLADIRRLRKVLLYAPASALDELSQMPPRRFLEFLGLTLLQRTSADTFWSGDYIVAEGEVERCRRTLHQLIASLQFRVVGMKEGMVRKAVQSVRAVGRAATPAIDPRFLRVLLKEHPCVEEDRKGYRLVAERLNYDCARLARIVYDARGPISLTDVLMQYERRYLQRPRSVSISDVRKRFPRVHSVSRGVWEWK